MIPPVLRTARLLLDAPRAADVERITGFCRDPLFEHTLTTPWPYERHHAERFVQGVVEPGWRDDVEYTFALRETDALLGVVALRREATPGVANLGYWLGAPARGRGLMTEAVRAVVEWGFALADIRLLEWEAVEGNVASLRVARAVGFSYGGLAPARIAGRDGAHPLAWHATLGRDDDRTTTTGWPA